MWLKILLLVTILPIRLAVASHELPRTVILRNAISETSVRAVETKEVGQPRFPESFRLAPYNVPTPSQGATSQCLKFAITGVLEWLKNKANCNRNPQVGKKKGVGDLSEYYTFSMMEKYGPSGYSSYFTDGPLAIRDRGFLLDRDYPHDSNVEYWMTSHCLARDTAGNCTHWKNYPFTNKEEKDLARQGKVRSFNGEFGKKVDFDRQILFSHPGQTAWEVGGINKNELNALKAALLKYKSPILFTYKPAGVDWWHTNMIIGYDKYGFIVQDSNFGEPRSDVPHDPTGKPRRGITRMTFDEVLHSAKHAAVYYLKKEPENDPDCKSDEPRTAKYDSYLDFISGAKAMAAEGHFERGKLPPADEPKDPNERKRWGLD